MTKLFPPRPLQKTFYGKEKNFILKGNGCYYLFVHGLGMEGSINVELIQNLPDYNNSFELQEKIKSIKWLDSGENLQFSQDGNRVNVLTAPQLYGEQLVVKIAKIEI